MLAAFNTQMEFEQFSGTFERISCQYYDNYHICNEVVRNSMVSCANYSGCLWPCGSTRQNCFCFVTKNLNLRTRCRSVFKIFIVNHYSSMCRNIVKNNWPGFSYSHCTLPLNIPCGVFNGRALLLDYKHNTFYI